jgi:membrane associated rhomboid family serine protease
MRLVKTFLSQRLSSTSVIAGVLGFFTLVVFFTLEKNVFSANAHLVFEKKQYWRLFTTTFVHADLNHLGHNALFFTGLSILLYHYFGFLVFPLLCVIAGGIINLVVLKTYPSGVYLVGASGVIYFMASFWMTLYCLIEKRIGMIRRAINCLALTLIFLFPEVFQLRVSYLAHTVGYILGIPFGIVYFYLQREKIKSFEKWEDNEEPVEACQIVSEDSIIEESDEQ